MSLLRTATRVGALLSGAALCAGLAACGGGSSNAVANLAPQNAGGNVRFANGIPSTAVDVSVDGTILFRDVASDALTDYVAITSGSHAVQFFAAGSDTTPLATVAQNGASTTNQSFGVNGSGYETLALGGRTIPSYFAFSDQTFNGAYNGYGAVNVYNLATSAATANFGVYTNPTTAGPRPAFTSIASPVALGTESNPIGLSTGVPIGFATAPGSGTTATATLLPGAVSPTNCAANTFACDSGFLSVFVADSPTGQTLFGRFSASHS